MIICADDYGLSPAVNDGIIELLESKRISAVSCMMLGSDVEIGMRKLQVLNKNFDLGLHLMLTNDQPLTKLRSESGLVDSQGSLLSFRELAARWHDPKCHSHREASSHINIIPITNPSLPTKKSRNGGGVLRKFVG